MPFALPICCRVKLFIGERERERVFWEGAFSSFNLPIIFENFFLSHFTCACHVKKHSSITDTKKLLVCETYFFEFIDLSRDYLH